MEVVNVVKTKHGRCSMEGVLSDHWKPGASCGARESAPVTEGFSSPVRRPPAHITEPTLIIWLARECVVCQMNKGFFDSLEAQELQKGFRVLRVEVDASISEDPRYAHVTSVPMYDVVTPHANHHTLAYGANTHLHSIRNDHREELSTYFTI